MQKIRGKGRASQTLYKYNGSINELRDNPKRNSITRNLRTKTKNPQSFKIRLEQINEIISKLED